MVEAVRSDDRETLGGVCAVGCAVAAQGGAVALAVAREAGGRRERERGEREEDEECGAEHCESDECGAVMYSECECECECECEWGSRWGHPAGCFIR